jgi:isoleucyl-tRNA synthetase
LDELNVKGLELVDSGVELNRPGYTINSEGDCTVAVPTDIPAELLAEGMAREIVHRLQTMRRSAGFDIADHIVTYYQGDAYTKQVIEEFIDYIKQETLSRQLIDGSPLPDAFTESYKLTSHNILLGVKRVD